MRADKSNDTRNVSAACVRFAVSFILLVAVATRLLPGPRTVDDAYITFRYARNLITGHGFVYNPGERVLGTTTPLYTLLMAGLALATGSHDFPMRALILNALWGAISVGLVYVLGQHFAGHRIPAMAASLLWAVAPYSVTFAIGGMETDLTVALLLATAWAHVTNHPRTMALLSALSLITRPDTAILIGLLWIDLTLKQRRLPWQQGLITLATLAPWLVFGTVYFGSPLTSSITAKSATYRLPPGAAFIRLLQHYATPFFEHKVLPSIGVFVVFIVYCALCGFGGLNAFHRNRKTWPLSIYPWVYFAVFSLANPLIFRWYLSPPLPFYFMLILTGLWTIITRFGKSVNGGNQPSTYHTIILALFATVALVLTLNAWDVHPDHGPDRPAPEMAWFKVELLYKRAADIVLSHANQSPNELTLCAGDIGMLGYRTNAHILDTVGLVTPASHHYYPADPKIYVTNYAIPADLVLALNPDYLVILEVYGRLSLLPDPTFQARYRLLDKLETDIYGSEGMLIFTRR